MTTVPRIAGVVQQRPQWKQWQPHLPTAVEMESPRSTASSTNPGSSDSRPPVLHPEGTLLLQVDICHSLAATTIPADSFLSGLS
ncbi:hypothetical protein BIW11_03752 [Tropilaelaps mercedesae]|uniref:Uncharacterized protein n=1 Tax=Tropilaelaps mercedesae TaxID=418985 RepID=A0A1V9XG89_9ACAR|nr:hypothetical protein BIW11_03752 [Tropilaelaps mercedesae]